MKHNSILVLCLLVGPALARPNSEPIYYRSNSHSNPLEVTEELIPTTNALPLITSSVVSADQSKALGPSGSTESEVTTPGSPTVSSTTTAAPGTTQDQQNSRYTKYADDALLSSESIIKDFFLKNLANFQQENTAGQYETLPSLAEEPNTLRSVSLAPVVVQQTSPNWGDPPDYQFSVNVQRKPVIHKIITKWTDKTQDVFDIDYNGQHGIVTPAHLLNNFGSTTGFFAFPTATPVPVLIVAKPVYPEVSNDQIELSLPDAGYSPEPERDVYPETNVYQSQDDPQLQQDDDAYQNEAQSVDVYQQEISNDAVYQQDPVDEVYNEPIKTKKKKNKNKTKTKKPEKQQQQQPMSDSDPDRPDAAYWNDQVEHIEPSGWQQQQGDDPYEEKDPYADALGALKDEAITECTGIRIMVNGKESCDEIEVTINRLDEVTKAGAIPPIIPPVVPVVPVAAAAAPEPSAALAAAPVANDATLFAAPLEPLASIPIVPPLPPPTFLASPIGTLMNSIMAPTRLGSGTSTAPGSGNKNKHKPHDDTALSDPGEGGGGSSMLTDASHALFGMLAAMSAMTPMNIMVLALAALPVIAMVMAGVGAGMYAYSKFTLPPIKNYSTIVLRRPPPVVVASAPHRWRRPVVAPPPSSTGWFDFSNMWSNIGWTADDRRSMRKIKRPSARVVPPTTNRLSPYRGHQPGTTTFRTTPKTATTVKTGR